MVLNVDEAAVLLGVSSWSVREQARSGRLPANKVGREWRFSRAALDEYLYGNTTAARDQAATGVGAADEQETTGPNEQDQIWLDTDGDETLPAYDWGPDGPPKGKPIRYVPGRGLIVEGGRDVE